MKARYQVVRLSDGAVYSVVTDLAEAQKQAQKLALLNDQTTFVVLKPTGIVSQHRYDSDLER